MKRSTLLFILLVMAIMAHSQAFNARYSYDARGNRLTESIIWLQTSLKSYVVTDSTIIQTLDAISETVADTTGIPKQGYVHPSIDSLGATCITIYPNPTHGMLLVKIDGNVETQNVESQPSISVYNITGVEILQNNICSKLNSVDLQFQPAGTYILIIKLGSLSKTYSIIKN